MLTRRTPIAALGALMIVVGWPAVAPSALAQAAAGPRFGENHRLVTDDPGRRRDVPGLAADPSDANHIVEADVDPVTLQCDYHVSFDGGLTWSGGDLAIRGGGENPPFPSPVCAQTYDSGGYAHFNAGIVFGSGQNVYIAFSAHRGPLNRPASTIDGGDGDDAVVARSTDGGRTFAPAVVAVPGGGPVSANPGLAGIGLRPQLAVQRGAAGGQDRLYVASFECYIRVRASQLSRGDCSSGGGDRRIWTTRSNDGGVTWGPRVKASAGAVRAGTAAAEAGSVDEQAREPSQPVVGPDGAVYVAYRNRDITDGTTCPVNPAITGPAPGGLSANKAHCIVIARSTDNGQTWVQRATSQPVSTATLSNPRLAIDPTSPAGVGKLYVVYQRPVTSDPSDITIQSSTDRGDTWSPAVRVNDDPAGAVQTNPWVSVGPSGRVDVVWGDRRHPFPGGGNVGDIYHASSTTGGATFAPNRRVSDRTFNLDVGWPDVQGDSLTPGASWSGPVSQPLPDGGVLAAWTDSREGNFDNQIQDIYLSRLNPVASIARRTIATATAPGLSVILSRIAFPGGTEALGSNGGDPGTRLVVANEQDVTGALAGAVLARARWGPLLLSPAAGLPAHVKAEATRMRPEGAYVVGDTSSLSAGVASDLGALTRGGANVLRVAAPSSIAAADRPAELGHRVAELLAPLPGSSPETVIVNPKTPEAAAAAGLASALRLPILFVDERTSAPPPTTTAISALGIKKALIVGGTQSVPAGVQTQLSTILGAANVSRLAGADQYKTSEAVLAEARLRGLPVNVVYVADGSRPVDAAALGAAVGRLNGLMLLTPNADLASAESRLSALGVTAPVDRLVAAIGTGGTDPVVPSTPSPPGPPGDPTPVTPPRVAGCPIAPLARNPILLTNGNDTRNGTPRGDLIIAYLGNDAVNGIGGDDCIDYGPDNDRGTGGRGDDFLQGGLGSDRLSGSAGKDIMRGGRGNDRLDGVTGNDSLAGGRGDDHLIGGSGNDSIRGDAGSDRVLGGRGKDRIAVRDGRRDRISCGSQRDRVVADHVDRVARDCEVVRRR